MNRLIPLLLCALAAPALAQDTYQPSPDELAVHRALSARHALPCDGTALKDFGNVTFFGEDEDPYPKDNDYEYIYDYTTCAPTSVPTKAPTEPPSNIPSDVPSEVPTTVPTTDLPTKPSETSPPTKAPTTSPTNAPTKEVECNDDGKKVCVTHASLSFGGR